MRSKLFKKTVAAISALSMIVPMTVMPMSASAEDAVYYSQNYETASSADWTTSVPGRYTPTLFTDAANASINQYLSVNQGERNNNGAVVTSNGFGVTADSYTMEFDAKLSSGAQWGTDRVSTFTINTSAGYLLKLVPTATGSTTWIVNESDVRLDLPGGTNNSSTDASNVDNYTWYHFKITLNNGMTFLTVTDLGGASVFEREIIETKTTGAGVNNIVFETNRYNAMIAVDNMLIRSVNDTDIPNVTYYDVNYVYNDTSMTEHVASGEYVAEVPDPVKIGSIFKGWNKDSDTTLYTTDEIKAMPITAHTTFTAVYEKDTAYIEPIVAVDFVTYPANNTLVAGADADTAASNAFGVSITGELGTDILANPDSRVTDFDVKYTLKGFRWIADKNEPSTDAADSNIYCDSYGELVVDEVAHTADFQLKSHPFNYYGAMEVTVTYNGQTMTISKPLVYIGNTANVSADTILPRGGYVSDLNSYSADMVGYVASNSGDNRSASDIITDNWATYGGNSKKLTIAEEDGSRFFKLQGLGTTSSCFAANQITAVTDAQVIFSQKVRFQNANSSILLKSVNPVTWNDNATTFSITFTGTELNLNGSKITDASAGVWYNVVITSDVTSTKCWAAVYDVNGNKLGESEIVNFTNVGSVTPTYYMFRTPDNSMGELDFNDVRIYRAAMDTATFATTQADETLSIPEAGQESVSTTLTASAKTTEGYEMIGVATWEIADETVTGVTVTPSADDSHQATLTVEAGATAGEVPVKVTLGGQSKTITVTLSSSQDSVKFTKSTGSVSIPLDDTNTVAEFSAIVIDGSGTEVAGKTVEYALYDKNNANPTTVNGVTFENGVLTVTAEAKPAEVYVRATSTNTNGETITKAIKVVIHGLAFDFGAGTEEDIADGYTPVTPGTSYTEKLGYGIEGTATVAGTASLTDASADYLNGTFTFKANVPNNKVYTVKVYYSGSVASEYVNSDLTGVALTNASLSEATYFVPVFDGVLDLAFTASDVAAITIEKQDDKVAGAKPNIYTVGDSTIANNGSWAYVLNRDQANYTDLMALATFSNNGRGGKNLSSYYTGGEFRDRVLVNIRPGDYVMIGDMGTNGMGNDFRGSFTHYVDACLALGAKVILNSYSPHGAVSNYAGGYDSATQTFNSYRQDSYDNIVREIYEERKAELAGFVDIGKNADASFNAYVDDYAANGYDSRDAAAQAIISCFSDHNHYSGLASTLMIEGYNGTKGIVSELVRILSGVEPDPTEPPAQETPTPSPEVTETPTPSPEVTETPTPSPEVTETPTPSPEVTDEPAKKGEIVQSEYDVTVTADVETAVLVHAIYKDGRLVKVDTTPLTFDGGEAVVTKEDLANGDKLMVWNSLKDMEPIADPAVVEGIVYVGPTDDPAIADTVIWKATGDVEGYTAVAENLEVLWDATFTGFIVSEEDPTPTQKVIGGIVFDGYISDPNLNGSWGSSTASGSAMKYTATQNGVLKVYFSGVGSGKEAVIAPEGVDKNGAKALAVSGKGEDMVLEANVVAGTTYYITILGSKGRFCGVAFTTEGTASTPEPTEPPTSDIPDPLPASWTVSAEYANCAEGSELMYGLYTMFNNTNSDGKYISSGTDGKWVSGAATGTALKYVAPANGTLSVSFIDLGDSSKASGKTIYIVEEGGSQDSALASVSDNLETSKLSGDITAEVEKGKTYYIYGAGTKARFVGASLTTDEEIEKPIIVESIKWTVSADDNECPVGTELIPGLTTLFANTATNGKYITSNDNGTWDDGVATGTALKYVAAANGTLSVSFIDLGVATTDEETGEIKTKSVSISEEGAEKDDVLAIKTNESMTDRMNDTVSTTVEAGKVYYIYGAGTKARFVAASFTPAQ